MAELNRTCLHDLHLELGAKMVPFAGYEMPVNYPMGVLKEHLHTRSSAGLFDVSHMGQVILRAEAGIEVAARALETIVPVDVLGLAEGRQRYGFFTNAGGGIEDDLMIANRGDHLFLVVNAARKDDDLSLMRNGLSGVAVEAVAERALIALQGPAAEPALARVAPAAAGMRFMDVAVLPSEFGELWVSRSGYTGEDGYEVSVEEPAAERFARELLAMDEVAPVGLGARDSLRLEAGLCLFGSDIDQGTSPVEAALTWAIQKARRSGGDREGRFPGAERILKELADGPARKRVGLLPEGRAPMRAGTELFARAEGGAPIGRVTSGAYGPSLERPVSMGYVAADRAAAGTALFGEVRGKRLPVAVAPMPFHPHAFKR